MSDREKLITLLRQNANRARRDSLRAKRYDSRRRSEGRAAAYSTALELVRTLTREKISDR